MRIVFDILSAEMERPHSYGWFHFLWLVLTFSAVGVLIRYRAKWNEQHLRAVLLIYAYTALILELTKQLLWTYDLTSGTWSYTWYAFPFQLCTTPIYAALLAAYTKSEKVRWVMLSYISHITIWGSIATMIYPESCFTKMIEVNIHTMFLHCGSFVLAVMIWLVGNKLPLKSALYGFYGFEAMALLLDIGVFKSGILNGDTFNMFYISPYFISPLPVFGTLQMRLPYPLFLLLYNVALFLGGYLVHKVATWISRRRKCGPHVICLQK